MDARDVHGTIGRHQLNDGLPLVVDLDGSHGVWLRDELTGREYLDATSGGVWCVNAGYGRDSIADAVAAQMKQMACFAGSVGTIPSIRRRPSTRGGGASIKFCTATAITMAQPSPCRPPPARPSAGRIPGVRTEEECRIC
jgi:hypothetical protein